MIKPMDLIQKFQYTLDNNWGYIWGTAGVMWTSARQNAATREQTVKYGKKWIGHNVADCSGLFAWAFKQLGDSIYHGSNTIYNKYCSAKGTLSKGIRTDGIALKPGTAVFTGTANDHGHIGLYIGNGDVIEAKGTQYGVVKSRVAEKKWTFWGELRDVTYGENQTETAYPTLRKGDKGDFVKKLQTALNKLGYDLGKWGIDGDFGSQTEKAVKAFQKDVGIGTDGVVGEKTWTALNDGKPVVRYYSVQIPNLTETQADALISQYPGSTKTERG